EAADGLGDRGFGFSLGIDSLGQLGGKEFFGFMQQIKAHCVWLLLGPPFRGGQKSRPNRNAAWAAACGRREASCATHSSHHDGQVCYPYGTTNVEFVKNFAFDRGQAIRRARTARFGLTN